MSRVRVSSSALLDWSLRPAAVPRPRAPPARCRRPGTARPTGTLPPRSAPGAAWPGRAVARAPQGGRVERVAPPCGRAAAPRRSGSLPPTWYGAADRHPASALRSRRRVARPRCGPGASGRSSRTGRSALRPCRGPAPLRLAAADLVRRGRPAPCLRAPLPAPRGPAALWPGRLRAVESNGSLRPATVPRPRAAPARCRRPGTAGPTGTLPPRSAPGAAWPGRAVARAPVPRPHAGRGGCAATVSRPRDRSRHVVPRRAPGVPGSSTVGHGPRPA